MRRSTIFLLLLLSSILYYGQSAKIVTITFDSIVTPKKYLINYLKGDYLHPIYGIDTTLTGKLIGKNKSGKTLFELNVVNGIFNGQQKYFTENGKLSALATFDNGTWVGEYLSYYPSGNIAYRGNYKNGLPDGLQTSYWENGNKNTEELLVNGALEYMNAWYENGEPQTDLNYSLSQQPTDYCLENMGKYTEAYSVKKFKSNITLELKIDSLVYSSYTKTIPTSFKLKIENESDLLRLDDSLFIKLFLLRNVKYGQKYYSFQWDYFKKTDKCIEFIQSSSAYNLYFNSEISPAGSAMGIGTKGDSNYFLIYFRYRIY